MSDSTEAAGQTSGPPWIRPDIQKHISWRNGDIVISVPAKSGTTWTMNIVHQLLTGGTAEFRDVYEEVPWIEFIADPSHSFDDALARLDAMPTGRRRAFKTHSAPPQVPYFPAGTQPDMKYVVVFRNPEEALVSFQPFLEKHSDEWFALWDMPRHAMTRPDFAHFYSEVLDETGMNVALFSFLKAWWPLRREENVLFLHYTDMKRDHEGAIRKIAQFLDIEPSGEQWPAILEYTSFPWMKQHENKFEGTTIAKVRILQSGAMIRKGQAGSAQADGMTGEIAAHLRKLGEEIFPDAAALDWFYEGGECP